MRTEVSRRGEINSNIKWKIGARADYDAAYDRSGFYPAEVRQDQRYDFMLRENYLDITAGNLEMRLGRQHIVWGEMVGLFIADVVSARDVREFILPEPDLETIRIPQWAARAEYFKGDYKAEAIWDSRIEFRQYRQTRRRIFCNSDSRARGHKLSGRGDPDTKTFERQLRLAVDGA